MLDLVSLPMPEPAGVIGWFLETSLVASVLALVAWVGARVRRLGPAVRHALWLVVLIKLMTPPMVHWPWSRPWPFATTVSSAIRQPSPDAEAPTRLGDEATPVPIVGRPFASITEPGETGDPGEFAFVAVPIATGPRATHGSLSPSAVESLAGSVIATARPVWRVLAVWLVSAWLIGSLAVGVAQARRILQFRRRLREATPAPEWLIAEAERIGSRLAVCVPTIRVVRGLGTPLLWCLGRPVLLVPGELLKSLEATRWRGILAHELAHLRRGDPWVRRLELIAGLVWWWNPLYWLAVRRLDFEAELACDAWVLWAMPGDRLGYAESLVRICASLSTARSPAPALGVAGTGRSFERRLMMILRDRVSHHASVEGILAATLLALLSVPTWSRAEPARAEVGQDSTTANAPADPFSPVLGEPGAAVNPFADDDDEDHKPKSAKKPTTAKAKKTTPKTKRAAAEDDDDREAALKEALGPDFEKKMEALGEKIAKEMEKRFGDGSDFAKKMEAFGKEMEEKFGPEFEKKMEAFGKEMEEKFGPEFEKKMEAFGKEMQEKFGPEFEKQMKALGKEMEGKLGKGSEFEKEMKSFGEKMAEQFGPDSDFAEKIKKLEKAKPETKAAPKPKSMQVQAKVKRPTAAAAPKAKASTRQRAARIEALESRIEELMQELKALKDQDNDNEEEQN